MQGSENTAQHQTLPMLANPTHWLLPCWAKPVRCGVTSHRLNKLSPHYSSRYTLPLSPFYHCFDVYALYALYREVCFHSGLVQNQVHLSDALERSNWDATRLSCWFNSNNASHLPRLPSTHTYKFPVFALPFSFCAIFKPPNYFLSNEQAVVFIKTK